MLLLRSPFALFVQPCGFRISLGMLSANNATQHYSISNVWVYEIWDSPILHNNNTWGPPQGGPGGHGPQESDGGTVMHLPPPHFWGKISMWIEYILTCK